MTAKKPPPPLPSPNHDQTSLIAINEHHQPFNGFPSCPDAAASLRPRPRRICVFCGSSLGARDDYRTAAVELADELSRRKIDLVYGGARVGLMGILADRMLEAGAHVIGVMPAALEARELAHTGLSELHIVDSMHERKQMMADLADAFIALPGGFGTFEELFETITWAQLGIHAKPCGLLNTCDYYAKLLAFLDHCAEEEFIRTAYQETLFAEPTPPALLERLVATDPTG